MNQERANNRLNFVRAISLLLTFCTGFTGLVYEVVWHSYLSNLLGSQAQAASIILAVFLGGLALGYIIFGRLSRNGSAQGLVSLCGIVEIGIGAWALFFPQLFSVVWQKNGIMPLGGWSSAAIDVGVAVFLIGLPTILMGGTLPLLTQGLARDLADAAPFHARVYAINTAGAFFGCLTAGFFFVPVLGLPLTVMGMGFVNLAAGLLLIIFAFPLRVDELRNSRIREMSESVAQRIHAHATLPIARACVVAFVAGVAAITLQTAVIRLVGLSMGSSQYAFSMVVSVFILMLALGAWQLATDERAALPLWLNQLLVVTGMLALYFLIPYWPYASHVLRTLVTDELPSFYLYHLLAFLSLAAVLAIPVGAMGSTLPLLFREARDHFSSLGVNVGRIYGLNTVGCVVGAIVGGHLLLYYVDLDVIIRICLAAGLFTVLLVFPWFDQREGLLSRVFVMMVIAMVGYLTAMVPPWPKNQLATGTFRATKAFSFSYEGAAEFYRRFTRSWKVLEYKDDPNTTVAVIESKDNEGGDQPSRSLWVNGKSDGSTEGSDMRTTLLLAHLPGLLEQAESKRAGVIGFGTGITVGALTLYPDIEKIDCMEIAPFVRNFSHRFDFANHAAGTHSKVQWRINDAYRVLGSSKEKYAIIVSEPSNPWVSGVERLYAIEFYDIVRAKLDKGGIYAQWFHTYSLSESTVALILNTFSAAFPSVHIFRSNSDLILIGSLDPLRKEALIAAQERFGLPEVEKELGKVGVKALSSLLADELWLPTSIFSKAGYHSLDFPKLSYRAGRDFFMQAGTDLNLLPEQEHYRATTRSYWDRSLLADYVSLQAEKGNAISQEDLAKYYCGNDRSSFFPGWRGAPFPCKALLVSLAVDQKMALDKNFSSNEITVLRALKEGTALKTKAASLEDAATAARLFADYRSPFLPISGERLLTYSADCFADKTPKHIECRIKIFQALAWNGFSELAHEQFDRLKVTPEVPWERLDELAKFL